MPKRQPLFVIDRLPSSGGATIISGGGGSSGTLPTHELDGAYHTGTLAWASVNKTGSNLTDLATRNHVSLSGIGENDHHYKATAGDGIALSATGGQHISVDLHGTNPGLEFASAKLRVKAADGIILDADGVNIDLATDPGLEFATAKLRVKAGDGLTRTATGVAVQLSTLSGLTLDGTTPNKTLALADSVAGNGLVIANKILAVGAGNGITVGADTVSLTTPGTLSVTSQNDPVGNHVHAILHSSNPGVAASLLSTSVTGSLQLVTLANNGTFVSGFAGNGYRIDQDVTEIGKTSAEFDNLTVRGRMRVYELLIQQIRATNGSVFISSSSTAEMINMGAGFSVFTTALEDLQFYTTSLVDALLDVAVYRIDTRIADPETGVLDDDRNLYHGFTVGDLIRAQRFEMNAAGGFAQVRVTNMLVTVFHNLWAYSAILINGDEPQAGDDFVRLGNTTDTTRQGSIYLTADDSNAPYIDIINDIASHADWNTAGKVKARVGRLTGITDSDFGGNLQGYGLYGNNVYLRGRMIITQGQIGTDNAILVGPNTTVIDGGKITTGIIRSNNWGTALGSEFDLATGVFRLGGSSAPKLSWNGTNLHIVGSITLTAPIPSGDVTGLGALAFLDGVTTAQVTGLGALATLSSVAWGTNLTGRPIELTDGRVAAALESTGTVKGRVKPTDNAVPGAVSGLYLGADFMGYFNGTSWRTYMDNTGRFYLTGTTVQNQLRWENDTLTVRGTVYADTGRIGGWNLFADRLSSDGETDGVGLSVAAGGVRIYAGKPWADRSIAPFRVSQNGHIYADSGLVGGWTLNIAGLTSTNIGLYPGASAHMQVGSGSSIAGVAATGAAADVAFWAGSTYANRALTSTPFRVTAAGALFSSNATITGTVTANAGSIAGSLTVGGSIRSGKTWWGDTAAGWWLGTDTTPKFSIGDNVKNLRWSSAEGLVLNQAALSQPVISGDWIEVGTAGLTYGAGWSDFGGDSANRFRYIRLGEIVMISGWVRLTSGTNDVVIDNLPTPDRKTFVPVRSSRPDSALWLTGNYADQGAYVIVNGATQYVVFQAKDSSQIRGDVGYIESYTSGYTRGRFRMFFSGSTSVNMDVIVNAVYRAA